MRDGDDRRYSIGELAEATGVSRRTVHFYVQRRLVDPPLGRGRGRHYDERHAEQIRRVRELQALGVPLGDARRQMHAPAAEARGRNEARPEADSMRAVPVVRVRLDRNVTVELAAGSVPVTPALTADLAYAIREVLGRHAAGRTLSGAASASEDGGEAAAAREES